MRIRSCERSLYSVLALSVLLIVGCWSEEPAKSPPDSSPALSSSSNSSPERDNDRSLGRILFVGNSITAGYGLEPDQAFPAIIQSMIDSAGFRYEVVNAGLSCETTSGGARRIEWLLRNEADVVVIELGGNDGLRGISPAISEANLRSIITSVREKTPEADIILSGMRLPINMGGSFRQNFEDVFPRVAKDMQVVLIPHILEGVGGVRELNQADGIHPTARGQRRVAANVWEYLEPTLADRADMTPAS